MMRGPQAIGDTGNNELDDLIGREWAFLFCDDDEWYLLQWAEEHHLEATPGLDNPGWAIVTEPLLTLPPLTCGTQRHFSAAFDQAARLVVAYEEAETVLVTRWDIDLGSYTQNVNFAGVDPVLVFDATWAYTVPGSDVILFYLTTDRQRLMARAQRDAYAIAYELWDFGRATVLDRVTRLPLRYQALASDDRGVPLIGGEGRTGLLSGLYPYPARERAVLGAEAESGEYLQVAIRRFPTEPLALAGVAVDGAYAPIVTRVPVTEPDMVVVSAVAADGAHELIVFRAAALESLSASAVASDGAHERVAIRYPHQQYDVDVGLSALAMDGVYEEVA